MEHEPKERRTGRRASESEGGEPGTEGKGFGSTEGGAVAAPDTSGDLVRVREESQVSLADAAQSTGPTEGKGFGAAYPSTGVGKVVRLLHRTHREIWLKSLPLKRGLEEAVS